MPNRTDGTVTAEEWQRFDALRPTIAKCRPYSLTKANLDYFAASQVTTVLLRPAADGDVDVEARVNELKPAIHQLLQWNFDVVVIPDNEPQLGARPYVDGYWEKIAQIVAHPALIGVWGETVKIASPPMAVAQGEEEWYEAGRDILPAFDFVAFHGYGQMSADLLHQSLAMAMQWNRPLIMDECGDSHPTANEELKANSVASYLRIASDSGVEMATLFMLGGSDEWRGFYFSPSVIERCIRPTVEMFNHAPA